MVVSGIIELNTHYSSFQQLDTPKFRRLYNINDGQTLPLVRAYIEKFFNFLTIFVEFLGHQFLVSQKFFNCMQISMRSDHVCLLIHRRP